MFTLPVLVPSTSHTAVGEQGHALLVTKWAVSALGQALLSGRKWEQPQIPAAVRDDSCGSGWAGTRGMGHLWGGFKLTLCPHKEHWGLVVSRACSVTL